MTKYKQLNIKNQKVVKLGETFRGKPVYLWTYYKFVYEAIYVSIS